MLLLVEVADRSLAYDRGIKLAHYARHGVREAWIVDIVNAVIAVFLDLGDGFFAVQEQRTEAALTPRLPSRSMLRCCWLKSKDGAFDYGRQIGCRLAGPHCRGTLQAA